MLRLNNLLLRNFRNYQEQQLAFHPKLNIICGNNAQGKTNLLEAIAYLSLGSSFRESSDEKIRRQTAEFFFLSACLAAPDGEHTLSAGYQLKKRFWKKDKVPCKKISEVAGLLHTVVFQPEDLELVKKGPELRRHFLDREMIQLYRGYHLYLASYKKALLQRNMFLKQLDFGTHHADEQLAAWEEQLAQSGAVVIARRRQILQRLDAISRDIHSRLTDGAEALSLKYICGAGANVAAADTPDELAAALRAAYAAGRDEDKRRRITLLGPHRDDFKIFINGEDARHFGSQGQQRTAALALKLSEVELVWHEAGYYPLLLLDDVFSELDAGRRRALLKLMLNKAQIFITATEAGTDLAALKNTDYFMFKVVGGHITKVN